VSPETSSLELGRATIFESATPTPDIGEELFHTASAAVDRIFAEDYDSLDPMLTSMTEALDTTGDLSRRLSTEITLRAIKRDAWWHNVVREHFGGLDQAPGPILNGGQADDVLRESFDSLLDALRESASGVSVALRNIDKAPHSDNATTIASDIASDVTNTLTAMLNVNRSNTQEMAAVYESVVSVADYLLTGAKFLNTLAEQTTAASNPTDRE
jgi:hypothetical protein